MALRGNIQAGSGEGTETEVEEPVSREDAIAAAWDDAEDPEVEASADEAPAKEAPAQPEDQGERAPRERDETGKFKRVAQPAKKVAAAPAEKEQATQEQEQPAQEQEQSGQEHTDKVVTPAVVAKPPQSWRPLEREALNKLAATPDGQVVLQAVARREAQMDSALKETQGIREFTNQFSRVMEPHRPLLAMLNTTPIAAVHELMRSASVIYGGDANLKAREVALLIKNRGIDPGMVADYLDGIAPKNNPNSDPRVAILEKQLGELTAHFTRVNGEADTQAQEKANSHVAEWSKDKPWFNDVRGRMRTLIAAADQQGEDLSLDDAYAIACSMDPQISKLDAQRKKAEAVKAGKVGITAAQRRAGSSPRPENTVRGKGEPTGDRESDVAAAWDEVEGRA